MTDDIMLTIGEDGKASLYDDTYDITIHCESQEEQDEVKRVLENIPHWIPVTERLPEKSGRYYVTEWVYHIDDKKHEGKHTKRVNFAEYSATEKKWRRAQALVVVAWMDNEPYKGVTE